LDGCDKERAVCKSVSGLETFQSFSLWLRETSFTIDESVTSHHWVIVSDVSKEHNALFFTDLEIREEW